MHEDCPVEQAPDRHVLEERSIAPEDVHRQVARQAGDGLRRPDPADDPVADLKEVLMVAAQDDHVLGGPQEDLEGGAQDAVEAVNSSVDVVAEHHEHGERGRVRGCPILPHPLEESGLQHRRLQARIAAVQVAQHGQVVLPARDGRDDVHVAVEERRLAVELPDLGAALQAARPRLAHALPRGRCADDELEVMADLKPERLGVQRVVLLYGVEERV